MTGDHVKGIMDITGKFVASGMYVVLHPHSSAFASDLDRQLLF